LTTFAVSMMRNEIDVVAGVVRHMAAEVDHVIVADNGSTDGTRERLDQLAAELPLTVVDDPEVGYYQSEKMSRLADQAGAAGAVWVVPFDADELWTSPLGRIRDVLALTPGNIAPAGLYNHWCTAVDDQDEPDPFRRIVWREAEPAKLPKVAFRWRLGSMIHQGNHGVDIPGPRCEQPGILAVDHFPYRSEDQFVAKGVQGAAAYRATDLPEGQGAHWRMYGEIFDLHGRDGLASVFRQHFYYMSPVDSGLVREPAPYRRWEPCPQ
jgi:hypothetical protein